MNKTIRATGFVFATAVMIAFRFGGWHSAQAASYYRETPVFSTAPNENADGSIDRFGPVGMGIHLHTPAFRMSVRNIEEGSPAAATGRLGAGQWIDSINGRTLEDLDPRKILGDILAQAEATDGRLVFVVRDGEDAAPENVVVEIPVLGAYSETWPLDCPKSDRIVRNMADYLARRDWSGGVNLDGPALLFLLSTGEEWDLEVARQWVRQTVGSHRDRPVTHHGAWMLGYGGIRWRSTTCGPATRRSCRSSRTPSARRKSCTCPAAGPRGGTASGHITAAGG